MVRYWLPCATTHRSEHFRLSLNVVLIWWQWIRTGCRIRSWNCKYEILFFCIRVAFYLLKLFTCNLLNDCFSSGGENFPSHKIVFKDPNQHPKVHENLSISMRFVKVSFNSASLLTFYDNIKQWETLSKQSRFHPFFQQSTAPRLQQEKIQNKHQMAKFESGV